jgi:hypothetical protein
MTLLMLFIRYLHYIVWGSGGAMFLVASLRLNQAREEHLRARDSLWEREQQLIDMIITRDDISKSLPKDEP